MSEPHAAVAHLLRATGFGVHRGVVEQWESAGMVATVDWVLADEGQPMPVAGTEDLPVHNGGPCDGGTLQQYYPLGSWWFRRMLRPEARLHEKMCLLWHSHFASSERVAEAEAMTQQHRVIRAHALGNFRTLAHEMVLDPAMLQWLDGVGSRADAPNENLSREFMELFTLGTDPWAGRPRFTEGDVRAGARALTGWRVDRVATSCPERFDARFEASAHDASAISLLGRGPSRLSANDFVDIVCDQPGTADFVARRVFRYLVGVDPKADLAAALADGFRRSGLEIRPLVAAILRSPEFATTRFGRARWPVEWSAAAHVALGAIEAIPGEDIAADLGQKIGAPVLVNGWSLDNRWVGAGACARKAKWIQSRVRYALSSGALDVTDPSLDSAGRLLELTGTWQPSESTLRAVEATWHAASPDRRVSTAIETALLTPEFLMT